MTAIVVSTDVSPSEWDAFVNAHPEASGYHALVWRDIFQSAFGHEARYLTTRRDGVVTGVLPLVIFRSSLFGRFVVSLPFVNYGGVLAVDDESGQALVDAAVSIARDVGANYVELRHRQQQFTALPARTHKVGMVLPLPADRDMAWTGLDRKVRNQVRKAERSGLSVETGGTELLDAFYGVFARNMRDLGTPVYSKKFFEAILTRLGHRASCVVVKKGQAAVAAGVTLAWRDTIEVPWASSLKESRSLCANILLYWAILERAIADGFSALDFGRSSPGGGAYHFKRQWGAVGQPLWWEYGLAPGCALPNLGPANPKFAPAIAAWKRLPLRLANLVGPYIVRSIP